MQTNDVPQSLSLTRARAGMPKTGSGVQAQRADAFSAILAAVPQLNAKQDGQMPGADEQRDAERADRLSEALDNPETTEVPVGGAGLGLQLPVGKSVNVPAAAARSEPSASTGSSSTFIRFDAVSDASVISASTQESLRAARGEADPSTEATTLGRKSASDAESALPPGLDAERGSFDGTTQPSPHRMSRGQNGVGNPLARAGLLPPNGRGLERDALHHVAAASQLRLDSTAALQNELARVQANHAGNPQVSPALAASLERRPGERFTGEASLTKTSVNTDHGLSWRISAADSGSASTFGTGAVAELGAGLIPGIAGRLADSLDEVSDRLSQSGRANRSAEAANPVVGAPVGQSTIETPSAVSIAPRLGSPDWSGAFAHAVAQVAADQLTEATLTISPPELGTIEIDLELHGDKMHIAFLSDSAEVRDSVESGLPALSQLLEKQGLSLGSADIRGNDRSYQGADGETGSRSGGGSTTPTASRAAQQTATEPDGMATPSRSTQRVLDGRVDLYA
jgi:flagellar hook-length control protein FliK